ncbi:MAG: pyruvate dehydrogenase complex dihydrolipoamide acetyltransferase [Methyloligellaceae bacterium]
MPISILMPALSPTMEEGTLAKWLVKEGDTVASGDVIAEIETDKATMEVEAVEEGKVGKILVGEGTTNVAVNAPIAVLLEEGEDASALASFQAAPAGPAAATSAPTETAEPSPAAMPEAAPAPVPEAAQSPAPKANGQGGRIFASPLARRLAAQNNIDLAALAGSGPHGRIVKQDIETAIEQGVPAPEPARAPEAAPAGVPAVTPTISDEKILALYEPGTYEVVPHDNMRRIIASRLTEAKQTIPHFYLSLDCELDALLAARRRLNAMSPDEGPKVFKISVNDLVIKAMAMALQKVPAANATWTEEGILRHKTSDIGVAVAIEGGLFTPVIRHAEVKSLSEISNEMRDLAERARNRRLAPHEYQGGTTSISNLGMFGIKAFDAVINPPHASILAVGAGEKRPIISGDDIKVATMMSVTLSCDHRVIDGALGAELLDAFKGFIEEPVTMLV